MQGNIAVIKGNDGACIPITRIDGEINVVNITRYPSGDISNTKSVTFHVDEVIEVAKAILKHYDVDFNAYEDNINERFRPLTKAEMEQHLKDNPNLVPVTIDPDAPLTSELAERFKDELK